MSRHSSSSNTHINPNSSTFLIKSQKHSHCPHSCIQPFMFTLISLNHPGKALCVTSYYDHYTAKETGTHSFWIVETVEENRPAAVTVCVVELTEEERRKQNNFLVFYTDFTWLQTFLLSAVSALRSVCAELLPWLWRVKWMRHLL